MEYFTVGYLIGYLGGAAVAGFITFPLTSSIACKFFLKFRPEYWSIVTAYWLAFLLSTLVGFPIGFYYGYRGEAVPNGINGLLVLIGILILSYFVGMIRYPDNTQIGIANGLKVTLTSYFLTAVGLLLLALVALLIFYAFT